jgi:hypothetical protein
VAIEENKDAKFATTQLPLKGGVQKKWFYRFFEHHCRSWAE